MYLLFQNLCDHNTSSSIITELDMYCYRFVWNVMTDLSHLCFEVSISFFFFYTEIIVRTFKRGYFLIIFFLYVYVTWKCNWN